MKATGRKTIEILQKQKGQYVPIARVRPFAELVEALKRRTPEEAP